MLHKRSESLRPVVVPKVRRQLLLVPFVPATWGWPAGTPANAPYGGNIYGGDLTYISAETLLGDAGATKDPATRSAKDWLCFSYAWRDSSLEDASLGAQFGPLDQHGGMQVAGCITGKFGLHQLPGEQPGALWNRSCKWGVGRAACRVQDLSRDRSKMDGHEGRGH